MRIAKAKQADIPELAKLLAILFSQEEEFFPDSSVQAKGLALIIEQPEVGSILVAHDNGKVIGMVNLLYTISTALGGRVCILEDMIVLPEFRGRGIGAELINSAITLARESGCLRITLLTDGSNISAQRFYQQFGFELSGMVPLRLGLI